MGVAWPVAGPLPAQLCASLTPASAARPAPWPGVQLLLSSCPSGLPVATHCHGVWRTPACSGLASHPPASELGLCGPTPRTPRGSGRAAPGLLVQESSRPRVPAPFWGLSPSCCSSWKGLVSQHLSPGWQGDDIGWLPRSPVSALAFPPQAWLGPPCPLPATSLDPAQTHLPLSP